MEYFNLDVLLNSLVKVYCNIISEYFVSNIFKSIGIKDVVYNYYVNY